MNAPGTTAVPGYLFEKWTKGFSQVNFPTTFPSTNTTYTAQWKTDPNWRTATFKSADLTKGTVNGAGPGNALVVGGPKNTPIPAPGVTSAPGYKFDRWTDWKGDRVNFPGPKFPDPNITPTYTANFVKDPNQWVTITFKTGPNGTIGGGTANVVKEVLKNSAFPSRPAPNAAPGYKFDGWYIGSSKVTSFPTNATENKTYTAKFVKDSDQWVTVTFKSADTSKGTVNGAGFGNAYTIEGVINVTALNAPGTTRVTGYEFDKWTTDQAGLYPATIPSKFPADDVTYYAQWKEKSDEWVTVTFTSFDTSKGTVNGATDNALEVRGIKGATLNAPGTTPVPGYVFKGWTTADKWGRHYPVVDLSKFPNFNATYYAQWDTDPDWRTVTFKSADPTKGTVNGAGTDGRLEVGGTKGTEIPVPGVTSAPGYKFDRWTDWRGDTVTFPHTKFPISKDYKPTYYAQWVEDDSQWVTTTFTTDGNGTINEGTDPISEKQIKGSAFPAIPTPAADTGYMFDGWYDGDAKVESFPETATKTKTYVAKFVPDPEQTKELSYTVEYYLDGQIDPEKTATVTKDVWIYSTTLPVDAGAINTTDAFEGKFFLNTDPATIPAEIEGGSTIKVYYSSTYTVRFVAVVVADEREIHRYTLQETGNLNIASDFPAAPDVDPFPNTGSNYWYLGDTIESTYIDSELPTGTVGANLDSFTDGVATYYAIMESYAQDGGDVFAQHSYYTNGSLTGSLPTDDSEMLFWFMGTYFSHVTEEGYLRINFNQWLQPLYGGNTYTLTGARIVRHPIAVAVNEPVAPMMFRAAALPAEGRIIVGGQDITDQLTKLADLLNLLEEREGEDAYTAEDVDAFMRDGSLPGLLAQYTLDEIDSELADLQKALDALYGVKEELCEVCGEALADGICQNTECPEHPDYVAPVTDGEEDDGDDTTTPDDGDDTTTTAGDGEEDDGDDTTTPGDGEEDDGDDTTTPDNGEEDDGDSDNTTAGDGVDSELSEAAIADRMSFLYRHRAALELYDALESKYGLADNDPYEEFWDDEGVFDTTAAEAFNYDPENYTYEINFTYNRTVGGPGPEDDDDDTGDDTFFIEEAITPLAETPILTILDNPIPLEALPFTGAATGTAIMAAGSWISATLIAVRRFIRKLRARREQDTK